MQADNENPAEFWNTVRKMAFKRALVHGSINATNTSELWSQDLEDLPQATTARSEYVPEATETFENAPQQAEPPKPPQSVTPAPKASPDPISTPKKATEKHRLKALNNLGAAPGQSNVGLMEGFLRSKGWIKVGQSVLDWPLSEVPTTPEQMSKLSEEVIKFEIQQREGAQP